MTKLRQLWLLTALASVAVLVGGHFLLVSPKTTKAAALREEAATQQQENDALRSQIQMLNRQKKDLPKQQAELERFAAKIPNNPALPALVRALSDASDNAGVELGSMAPAQPVLVTNLPSATPNTPATSAAAAPTVNRIPLASIAITVKVRGTYSEMSQFFSEVEGLPRAFLVSGFTITRDTTGSQNPSGAVANNGLLIGTITGQLYMTTKAPAPPRPQPAATTVVN